MPDHHHELVLLVLSPTRGCHRLAGLTIVFEAAHLPRYDAVLEALHSTIEISVQDPTGERALLGGIHPDETIGQDPLARFCGGKGPLIVEVVLAIFHGAGIHQCGRESRHRLVKISGFREKNVLHHL